MKTTHPGIRQQQTAPAATEQTGKTGAVAYGAVKPFPASRAATAQRKAIVINGETLFGSAEEYVSDAFWLGVRQKFKDVDLFVALRQMIQQLEARRDTNNASAWDLQMIGEAKAAFSNALDYKEKGALDEQTGKGVQDLLIPVSEGETDEAITEKEIHGGTIDALVDQLEIYVSSVKNPDKPNIPLSGPKNQYALIHTRAVEAVLHDYGVQMMHAATLPGKDDTAFDNLNNGELHHSTNRATKASEETVENERRPAINWSMSNVPAVKEVVSTAQSKIHTKSSFTTIAGAYTGALLEVAKKSKRVAAVLNGLARVRLSWGPITVGKSIYIQATMEKMSAVDQWLLLETLIHESLHTAEHPDFHQFLVDHIPESLHSDIREGITEYFTRKIMIRVNAEAEEGNVKASTNPASTAEKLVTSKATLSKIAEEKRKQEELNGGKEYEAQVQVVEAILKLLEDGETRLEQAYFYGNVNAFLPKIKK